MDWTVRGLCMKNILKEVSNENDRKTSEGEQLTASNKLHSSYENQKPVFLGLLKGLFIKSWSQRKEMRPRHLFTNLW